MRPPGQTSRKGTGLGANKRRAAPEGVQRAPLARARHPPSGGLVSGAVVGSSARGTWGASAAYYQCPNHPGRWGEPAGTTRKAPRSPSQQPRKTTPASQLRRRATGANKTFFSFFITGHYLGVLLGFFWRPVTGSKEQRSAQCQAPPAPGTPRPARCALPAGCRAAA
jgi:hypothetical protein